MARNHNHDLTRHHRKCRSKNGTSTSDNISIIPHILHESWHRLFKNYDAKEICEIINETYIDPDYEFICIKRRNNG